MPDPTSPRGAALAAGGATLGLGLIVALVLGGGGDSAVVQDLRPAADASPSATSTSTATSTPSATATATSTPSPSATSTTPPPPNPAPTLAMPFGMPGPGMPGGPGGYLPYANPSGGEGRQPSDGRSETRGVDSRPGQKVRYRMYTCTNYEVKEGAPAAYHCVPESDPATEQSRYYGFYGQNKDSGSYGVPQGQAYPQGQYQYPTQPYPYSNPVPGTVTFTDCTQARAAGYSNIQRGAAGYATNLDRDNDGIACEVGE